MSNLLFVKKSICKYLHLYVHVRARVYIIKSTVHIIKGKCRISESIDKYCPCESPVVLAWVGTQQ